MKKPKFYQAILKEVDPVKHCYPQRKVTIQERMGDKEAKCPECNENEWYFLPIESGAVREGGKCYMNCLKCGYGTHF